MAKKRTLIFLRDQNAGNPERARWSHLSLSGSQSEHRIRLILPAREFSLVISFVINLPSVPSQSPMKRLVNRRTVNAEIRPNDRVKINFYPHYLKKDESRCASSTHSLLFDVHRTKSSHKYKKKRIPPLKNFRNRHLARIGSTVDHRFFFCGFFPKLVTSTSNFCCFTNNIH